MRLLGACAVGALIALVSGAGNAFACSCAAQDPNERLEREDAAVVGTVIDRRRLNAEDEFVARWEYTLRVEEDYKRDLGETELVRSHDESPTCGLELSVGDRVGLFLSGGEPWEVGLCDTFEPGELRSRANPPPPARGGRLAFLAGGFEAGPARLLGLDRRGRTVAYGRGRGTTTAVAACPGGRRAVEFVERERGERPYSLAVRRLDTFRVERSVRLDIARSDAVAALECADRRAREAYVLSSEYRFGGMRSELVRMRGPRAATIARGRSQTAAFGDGVVYVDHDGRELRVIDLSDGSSRTTARNLSGLLHLSLSPDRASLAMVLDGQSGENIPNGDTRVAVVALASDALLTHTSRIGDPGNHGGTVWLDSKRLFFYPTCCGKTGRLFDREANALAQMEWRAGDAAAMDGRLYGAAGDLLYVGEPPAAGRRLRTLFGDVTSPLEAVPGRPRVRASRACASAAS